MTKNAFFVKNFTVMIKMVKRGLSVSNVQSGHTNFMQELSVGKHSPAIYAENILVFYKFVFQIILLF